MSTYFEISSPYSIKEFCRDAKKLGWVEGLSSDGSFALISSNGHYCHSIEEFDNGVVGFVRYGGNTDVYDLAHELGALSEHDLLELYPIIDDEEED